MGDLSAAGRRLALARMAKTPLDVLVIGGGITGAGVALDAAARGYSVGLVERGDFASGTSSQSTKLVHGGIRYLPQLDIPLVREALVERGRLLRNAPHLVHPLTFILPLYASSRHPVGLPIAPPFGVGLDLILDPGLALYDELAGKQNLGKHRRIDRHEVLARARCLTPVGLKSGFIYHDAQTDDPRLTLAVLRTADEHGALLANYCAVTGFAHDDGRVAGVYARETLPGDEGATAAAGFVVRARHVVNATGVWAEQTERLDGETPTLQVAPSKGTHPVFTREGLDLGDEAIVLPETEDGRIIFIVPWQSRALVGTTDNGVEQMETPVATEDDIDYLLGHLNRSVRRPLARADIVATYAGYRPLLRLHRRRTPARLSRTHAVTEGEDGLLTVSGGKLTTYRLMAQDVVDRIDRREGHTRRHVTLWLPLSGAPGERATEETYAQSTGEEPPLDDAVLAHLSGAYGSHACAVRALVRERPQLAARLVPDLPYIGAEVVYVCRTEMALTLEDVLARRTHIAIEDRSRGLDAAPVVAGLMAEELGWSSAERERQLAAYRAYAQVQAGPLPLPSAAVP